MPKKKKPTPPFHDLFTAPELAHINVDYRCAYKAATKDEPEIYHALDLLKAADADAKRRGISYDAYTGRVPGDFETYSDSEPRDWYANGTKLPKDRPGLVAMFHPQFHKRGWEGIAETVTEMAQALQRWMWIVEAEESRWYLVMVGDDPNAGCDPDGDNSPAWKKHVRVSDQYIGVVSPKGEWKMLGCS